MNISYPHFFPGLHLIQTFKILEWVAHRPNLYETINSVSHVVTTLISQSNTQRSVSTMHTVSLQQKRQQ